MHFSSMSYMPHVLTSHWLCVPETTVWALMNDFNTHMSRGNWFGPHRPCITGCRRNIFK